MNWQISGVAFLVIALLVALGATQGIDNYFTKLSSKSKFWELVTELGNTEVVFGIALLILPLLSKRKQKVLAFSLVSGSALVALLKVLFSRPRPNLINNHSFPSGHSTLSFILYFYLFRNLKSFVRYFFLALAFLVPLSRLMLSFHWLTDVIAGVLLGYTLLGFFSSISSSHSSRRARQRKQ